VLSDEQQAAMAQLLRFSKQEQTLGGFAGTGKSTIVAELIRRLPDFRVCAFTGKAANVLRRKGVEASTIHSLIYRPVEVKWQDEDGNWHREVRWRKRDPADFDGEGFIVDEASMVSRDLYDDLVSYDLPIIFVGDHGQLPPVASGVFNPMARPDITLETIHRHAGEIPRFAEFIRMGYPPSDWRKQKRYTGTCVRFLTPAEWVDGMEDGADQVIVAFNSLRVELNMNRRARLGFPPDHPPVPGDRVMCLQNNHDLRIFNGQQGVIVAIDPDSELLVFRTDEHEVEVPFLPAAFHALEKLERDPDGRIPFDYAYAVTAHKAQGDEWDHVFVVEQRCRYWEHARWAYTAATRQALAELLSANERNPASAGRAACG
jgi:exodeoxyribonuclease-5